MDALEKVAVDQADMMSRMVRMMKDLISELAQYRVMDEEERQLEDFINRMGGKTGGDENGN